MSIDIFSYSGIGSRVVNEDYCIIDSSGRDCIAVLCDGLGGHNCGEVASEMAGKSIVELLKGNEEICAEKIYNAVVKTNGRLMEAQNKNADYRGMRTTAVGCVICDNKLHYFNVGDSRFYFFHNGNLKYITKDHSVSQISVELGQIGFDDIRGDADRNKLLKVLGEKYSGEAAAIYKPVKFERGDAFLLCSDGFWEYILEREMEIDLSKAESAKDWINYMLVRHFLKMNGKNDNYTVVGGIVK